MQRLGDSILFLPHRLLIIRYRAATPKGDFLKFLLFGLYPSAATVTNFISKRTKNIGFAHSIVCLTRVRGCLTSCKTCLTRARGCLTSYKTCLATVRGCLTSCKTCLVRARGCLASCKTCLASVRGCLTCV